MHKLDTARMILEADREDLVSRMQRGASLRTQALSLVVPARLRLDRITPADAAGLQSQVNGFTARLNACPEPPQVIIIYGFSSYYCGECGPQISTVPLLHAKLSMARHKACEYILHSRQLMKLQYKGHIVLYMPLGGCGHSFGPDFEIR